LQEMHAWAGPLGGLIVVGVGYTLVRRHRRLYLDEILAGVGLVLWIIMDRLTDSLFGGANLDLTAIWEIRGALFLTLVVIYVVCRRVWHVEKIKA